MKFILDKDADHLIRPWMEERTEGTHDRARGPFLALMDSEKGILAACQYTDCNGASLMMHCAGDGKDWLNREFLWYAFYFPFEELKVRKIISPVEDSNEDSIKFLKHLGFNLEAILQGASPKGNLLLYTLSKGNCKWLSLKDKYRGESLL